MSPVSRNDALKKMSDLSIEFVQEGFESFSVCIGEDKFDKNSEIKCLQKKLTFVEDSTLPKKLAEISLYLLFGSIMNVIETPECLEDMDASFDLREIRTPKLGENSLTFYAKWNRIPQCIKIEGKVSSAAISLLSRKD